MNKAEYEHLIKHSPELKSAAKIALQEGIQKGRKA